MSWRLIGRVRGIFTGHVVYSTSANAYAVDTYAEIDNHEGHEEHEAEKDAEIWTFLNRCYILRVLRVLLLKFGWEWGLGCNR